MTNTEKIIEELKALPEIELAEVIEEIHRHIEKEKWNHLLVDQERVTELEDELRQSQSKSDEFKEALSDIESIVNRTI